LQDPPLVSRVPQALRPTGGRKGWKRDESNRAGAETKTNSKIRVKELPVQSTEPEKGKSFGRAELDHTKNAHGREIRGREKNLANQWTLKCAREISGQYGQYKGQ